MTLSWMSEHYRWLFLPLGLGHFVLFISLWTEHTDRLAALRVFIRNLARRVVLRWSDERPNSTVDEEIDILLHDLRDALPSTATWDVEKTTRIREAVFAIDQPREYLYGTAFEKRLSLAKTITEIYPLLGIVGTVLAIAAGMAPAPKVELTVPAAEVVSIAPHAATPAADSQSENELRNVTSNFGHSVWTTLIGLSLAIFFMLITAWIEPEFHRMTEYKNAIRDILHQIKSRLDAPVPAPLPEAGALRLPRPLFAGNEPPH